MNSYLLTAALLCLLLPAVYFDTRSYRIPNGLSLTGIIVGLFMAFYLSGWQELESSILAMLLAFGIGLLFWLLGWLGAGDVKLLAAVGTLIGTPLILKALIFTAFSGGVLALVMLAWHGKVRYTLSRIITFFGISLATGSPLYISPDEEEGQVKLPYAVAIATGSLGAVLL